MKKYKSFSVFNATSSQISEIIQITKMLHKKGIIHNDHEPSNIVLDDTYRQIIIDFGISIKKNEGNFKINLLNYYTTGTGYYRSPRNLKKN